jgi:hypothetical protein
MTEPRCFPSPPPGEPAGPPALAEVAPPHATPGESPYRGIWLAEQEAQWAADPVRELERQQAEAVRLFQEQFGIDLGLLDERPGR